MTQNQNPDQNGDLARVVATPDDATATDAAAIGAALTGGDVTGGGVTGGGVTGAAVIDAGVTGGDVTGATVISDAVIMKIIGIAVRQVPGVKGIGGGASRAFGAIRDAIGSGDPGQGVRVKVRESDVSVDLVIVADYPVALQEVAKEVRAAVVRAIEDLVGMSVAQVNVTVGDVEVPDEDEQDASETAANPDASATAPGAGGTE